ncbi:DUF305 domain-containing protein [Agromyces albus]|uniref:DUF305 domain-containing protein n=1 Tax=Agromyces albus TaxID=205332 RepID=UPI002787BF1F|nr:DUF305 domain-containing protein [Agromyces albus]MDQ0577392.1 uncharacterized protein (DUF305 family) [Agromyces albus]
MLNTRKIVLVTAAAAVALTLTGCAGGGMSGMDMSASDAPGPEKSAGFNDADVMFAQMMIPHHEQAVEMSDLLLAEDGIDDRVRDLATQIKNAQQPEIDQMTEMLSEWGQEESGMGGMDGGGLLSDEDMTALEDATGDDAARLFLEGMIVHHEGAIEMAEAEAADGENAEAKELAETIIAAQTDEIAVMQELLADF